MERTTIHLPADLRARAKREARARGMKLAELVRLALDREIRRRQDPEENPLLGMPTFKGGPRSLSMTIQDTLYGR